MRTVILCFGMLLFQVVGIIIDFQRHDSEILPLLLTMRGAGVILCVALAVVAYLQTTVKLLNAIPIVLMSVLITLYTISAYEYSLRLASTDSTIVYGFLSLLAFVVVTTPLWGSLIISGIILFEALILHSLVLGSNAADFSTLILTYLALSALGLFLGILSRRGRRSEYASIEQLKTEEAQRRSLQEQLHSYQAELETKVALRTEQLRESQQSLLQAQKMESIGQLAGGMAHDINNVLLVIIGYEGILTTEDDLTTIRKYLAEMRIAAERGAETIRQLLAFSRRQVMNLEPVELGPLITKLHGMMRVVIPANIGIELDISDDPVCTLADSRQLEQALTNLIINARDAMPDGGTLRLRVSIETLDSPFVDANPWAKVGLFSVISVADNGCGISDNMKEKIFEPFFTSKPEGEGTGLGLAMVFGTVSQLEGFIHVTSSVGEGAEFKLYLPNLLEAMPKPREETTPSDITGTETILLIEDDAQIRELESLVLRDAGYTIIECADGLEGLDAYKSRKDEIDMLLLDVVLPRMGGEELLKAIREMGSDVPVLFKSGYSKSSVHTNFIVQEGLPLLSKPYALSILKRRIREILEHRV